MLAGLLDRKTSFVRDEDFSYCQAGVRRDRRFLARIFAGHRGLEGVGTRLIRLLKQGKYQAPGTTECPRRRQTTYSPAGRYAERAATGLFRFLRVFLVHEKAGPREKLSGAAPRFYCHHAASSPQSPCSPTDPVFPWNIGRLTP